MCIPMPQHSIHLSPTPPCHTLLLSPICSISYTFLPFPSLSSPPHLFLLTHFSCFSYIRACSTGSTPSYTSFIYTHSHFTLQHNLKPCFIPRMDRFSAPFSVTTTNPSTNTTATTSSSSSSSSSNVSHSQQNMGHPQNVHFSDNSGPLGFPSTPSRPHFRFPPPYFLPYDQNLQFPYMHTFEQVNHHPLGYPMYSLPMEQNSVRMPNYQPQGWSQSREEYRKMKEAWMRKIARDKRKQARQRSKSSAPGAPSMPEGTIRRQPVTSGESNVQVTVTQNRNTDVFCAPDGKRLREILTKKLQNSDVGSLGRIVLPKREAEVKLPALRDKEGIDFLLKDVYSDLQWSLKYKYWCNNKSRMYVLENTGDFVNHYELQMGDSVTLYEDEFKNLRKQYVSTKKEQNPEVAEPSSGKEGLQTQGSYNYSCMHTTYTHQAKDEEEEASLALLIKELNHKREEEAANSFLTMCKGGGSSSGTEYDKIEQDTLLNNNAEGAPSQVAEQETIEAAASSSKGQTTEIDDDQQSFDDVYGGLDNIFEVGCNYLSFDHFTH